MTQAFIAFHLNLAYSSIAESSRLQVIEKCYFPLLELAKKTGIPIGIELTGWTLRQIQQLAPDWVQEFKAMLARSQCELIGSGYVQAIGPLMPYEVNLWNQKLGLADYQEILEVQPKIVLVNEMAFSTGLVGIYQQLGYQGIIMDRDNIRLALGLENEEYEAIPSYAKGLNQSSIPVLWSDSILFQKLQRYAHGDSRLIDYLQCFRKRAAISKRPLAVYCNDAEIFDYRPGRFAEERPAHEDGEWNRLMKLLTILSNEEGVKWSSPTEALDQSLNAVSNDVRILSSITQPIPVKKQSKYNVSRWAITGRNNLWINTLCYRLAAKLKGSQESALWRSLCECWASDLRTHIEAKRWEAISLQLEQLLISQGLNSDYQIPREYHQLNETKSGNFTIEKDPEQILLTIKTPVLVIVFNLRRGLAIQSLSFASQDFEPILGTLAHGYYDSIEYGADFYSGGVIVELPMERRRVTDLERVEPIIEESADELIIHTKIMTAQGEIIKSYKISSSREAISFRVEFPDWERKQCILRAGVLSFLPEAFKGLLQLKVRNGGADLENFDLNQNCDHIIASSSLVSSTTGFGATSGEIIIGDQWRSLRINWNPANAAVFPMLNYQKFKKDFLMRLYFSLSELDESMRPGGIFPDLEFQIEPASILD